MTAGPSGGLDDLGVMGFLVLAVQHRLAMSLCGLESFFFRAWLPSSIRDCRSVQVIVPVVPQKLRPVAGSSCGLLQVLRLQHVPWKHISPQCLKFGKEPCCNLCLLANPWVDVQQDFLCLRLLPQPEAWYMIPIYWIFLVLLLGWLADARRARKRGMIPFCQPLLQTCFMQKRQRDRFREKIAA